jgi:hypothetical protein
MNWSAVGLFCEDVRDEAHSRHTLLGVLPDNMDVPKFPGTLNKLGVYVRVHIDATADVGPLEVRIKVFDNDEQVLGGFDAESIKKQQEIARGNQTPTAGFIISAVAGRIPIARPGRINLIAQVGEESIVCGSLRLFTSSSSSDPAQPASQSAPASPEKST